MPVSFVAPCRKRTLDSTNSTEHPREMTWDALAFIRVWAVWLVLLIWWPQWRSITHFCNNPRLPKLIQSVIILYFMMCMLLAEISRRVFWPGPPFHKPWCQICQFCFQVIYHTLGMTDLMMQKIVMQYLTQGVNIFSGWPVKAGVYRYVSEDM